MLLCFILVKALTKGRRSIAGEGDIQVFQYSAEFPFQDWLTAEPFKMTVLP